MSAPVRAICWRDSAGLAAIWLVATAYNLFKPYHVDDTAHLIIANWIARYPLHPMQGWINWSGMVERISTTNQPHLYFYVLALWGKLFGFGEPAMHLLQALFTGGCAILFYLIARRIRADAALWLTAMLVLNPAFLVEQNLMVDVPLLCTWLGFFFFVFSYVDHDGRTSDILLAATALACAVLIKYSSVALFPIFLLVAVSGRKRGHMLAVLIPVLVLASWSAFNIWDYGSVHILKPTASMQYVDYRMLRYGLGWILAIGALSTATITVILDELRSRRILHALGAVAALSTIPALCLLANNGLVGDRILDLLVNAAFLVNGAIAIALAIHASLPVSAEWRPTMDYVRSRLGPIVLVLWPLAVSGFYVLFAPFVAARHILLILPALLLIFAMHPSWLRSRTNRMLGLAVTITLTIGLGVSDWRSANFYKTQSRALAAEYGDGGTLWTTGHWGWQWYAWLDGMKQIDVSAPRFAKRDYVIVPNDVDHQRLTDRPAGLVLVRTVVQDKRYLNLLCAARPARFYASSDRNGPWSISRNCVDRISVYRITQDQD